MPYDRDSTYAVGYKKAPQHTKFKKGRSGNPKGRPKQTRNLDARIICHLDDTITMTRDGVTSVITKQEAMAYHLYLKAMAGDVRAMKILLLRARAIEPAEESSPYIIKYQKANGELVSR